MSNILVAALRHILLLLLGIFSLLPFAVMLSTSLKSADEIFSGTINWWPRQLAVIENYSEAFSAAPLAYYLLNGALVTAAIFLLQALVALPAAYALAKLRFVGRRVAFGMVLFCLLIPYHVIAVPLFILFYGVGLLDSYSAMILPFTISVFGIFLLRQFFMGVPDDLVDAARMDGMSELSIVWRVMLPAAVPALTAFGIFSVVAHWNDYFWPLIVISSDRYMTPPLGIMAFRNAEAGNNYGPLMAAATIVVAPLLALFLLAQRRFIEGMTFTGIK
ncbi:carbohydrate ABC transporter permease [Rhizobium puerariae]|uniref:Carbohydrate ABC transporter permease n=1 Tax=Rhizobium puerariae TaxID=1585791 RepID=A0ABV6ADW3_9HYPH